MNNVKNGKKPMKNLDMIFRNIKTKRLLKNINLYYNKFSENIEGQTK